MRVREGKGQSQRELGDNERAGGRMKGRVNAPAICMHTEVGVFGVFVHQTSPGIRYGFQFGFRFGGMGRGMGGCRPTPGGMHSRRGASELFLPRALRLKGSH